MRTLRFVTTKRVSGPSAPTSTRAMIRSTQHSALAKSFLRPLIQFAGIAFNRPFGGQFVDLCRVDARIDRPGHQSHATRLRFIAVFRHQRGSGKHSDARLANRDDVRPCAHDPKECDHVVHKGAKIEAAFGLRHVAKIMPVGDKDVMVGQHRFDRGAQKCREMARHGGDQQHPWLWRFDFLPEVKQRCKRREVSKAPASRRVGQFVRSKGQGSRRAFPAPAASGRNRSTKSACAPYA